jgi:hypothetical protein
MKSFIVTSLAFSTLAVVPTWATISSPHPYDDVQPDGEHIQLHIQGHPYDNYITDTEGK